MELTLRDRKLINNSSTESLPHLAIGTAGGFGSLSESDPSKFFGANRSSSDGFSKSVSGTKSGFGGYAEGALGTANMGFQIADAAQPDIDEGGLINKYGTTQMQAGDTSYQAENLINVGAEMNKIAEESRKKTLAIAGTGAMAGLAVGGAIGSAGGPIGAAIGAVVGGIGGLIAGGAAKRKAQERLRQIQLGQSLRNNGVRDLAMTQSIRRNFSIEHGNQQDQLLYGHAKYGKTPDFSNLKDRKFINNTSSLPRYNDGTPDVNPMTKETFKSYLVDTSKGMAYGPQNAWGNKGEWIQNGLGGYLHKIQRGTGDTARLHLEPNDIVYSNSVKNPVTGNTIAKDVPMYAKLGRLPELLQTQAIMTGRLQTNNDSIMRAKYGRIPSLPKFRSGAEWWTNAIPALTGLTAGWMQYNQARNDDYDRSTIIPQDNTWRPISKMYEARVNPLPMIHQIQRQASAAGSDIKRSGGLSIGQKVLGGIALDSQTQANIANALLKYDAQNQELQRAAADAEVKALQERARLEMQGRQYDRTNTAAAHNARQQGMQMGMYNMQNALEQYFANEFKRYQFDNTMSLYRNKAAMEDAYYKWLMGQYGSDNKYAPKSWDIHTNTSVSSEPPVNAEYIRKHIPTLSYPSIESKDYKLDDYLRRNKPEFTYWSIPDLNKRAKNKRR